MADYGIIAQETGHAIQYAYHSPLFFLYWTIVTVAKPVSWLSVLSMLLGLLSYVPLLIFWLLNEQFLVFGLWGYTTAVLATAVISVARLDAHRIALKHVRELPDAQPTPEDIEALKQVLRAMAFRDLAEVASWMGIVQSLQGFFTKP